MAQDPKTRFSYTEIVKAPVLSIRDAEGGRFASHSDDPDFIYFGYVQRVDTKVGWKAHIAIDDSVHDNSIPAEGCCGEKITYSSNLANAWEIIKNIAIDEKIISLKIVKPEKKFATKDPKHCGKQITLYCLYQLDDMNWQHIFTRITQELAQNGIVPAPHAQGDLVLEGSHYITYRNDDDGNGLYYYQGENPNPGGFPNPFEDMAIMLEEGIQQLPVPEFNQALPEENPHHFCPIM